MDLTQIKTKLKETMKEKDWFNILIKLSSVHQITQILILNLLLISIDRHNRKNKKLKTMKKAISKTLKKCYSNKGSKKMQE